MDKEGQLITQVNSLLKQKKELESLQVSENNNEVDLQIKNINSQIQNLITELELSSEEISPKDMNILFG